MSDGLSELRELINPEGTDDQEIISARHSFWEYCKFRHPKFFKEDRTYLKEYCNTLQGVFEGTIINPKTGEPYKKVIVNMPPRHGKSFVLALFVQWCMGKNNETSVISVSYNDILAGRFSRNVRDDIDAENIDGKQKLFSDVFPTTNIKQGDASHQLWSLEGQHFSYLSAGFGGTITGLGCSIGIIDDPIKNNREAFNDTVLQNQWNWYGDTFLSRLEEGALQIMVMTRWSTKDLCGRLLDSEDKDEWLVFSRAACIDEEKQKMLCAEILSYKTYVSKRRITSPEISDANYQQVPVDIKGKLYSYFTLYDDIPRKKNGKPNFERIISYTDTADTGSDDLVSMIAGQFEGCGYVLDIYMTDAPMEETEPETARRLYTFKVKDADIESNNGGRGFARNVKRLLWENHKSRKTNINWFHQSENKQARIFTNSTFVMNNIKMPKDWEQRFPKYYAAMNSYQKAGKNKHDDAPDCTTGLAEMIQGDEGSQQLEYYEI